MTEQAFIPTPQRFSAEARRIILRYAHQRTIHVGSSLSVVDILAAVLGPGKDGPVGSVILSKGHGVWAWYAVLAALGEARYADATGLPGHPHEGFPGITVSTGSLGHGLAIGCGIAEGRALSGSDEAVVVVMGDGELDEGTVWESAAYASRRGLRRMVAVVDLNGLQQEGPTQDGPAGDIAERRWQAFGWRVLRADGHDVDDLRRVLNEARDTGPAVVLASTVKGKGVSFMEHQPAWHTGMLDDALYAAALAETAT